MYSFIFYCIFLNHMSLFILPALCYPLYQLTSRLVLKIQSKDVTEYLGAEVSLCVSLFMHVDEEMDSF